MTLVVLSKCSFRAKERFFTLSLLPPKMAPMIKMIINRIKAPIPNQKNFEESRLLSPEVLTGLLDADI